MIRLDEILFACPACGHDGYSGAALHGHFCQRLGRKLSKDEWYAAMNIEEVKAQMAHSDALRSKRKLRALRARLGELLAVFPPDASEKLEARDA